MADHYTQMSALLPCTKEQARFAEETARHLNDPEYPALFIGDELSSFAAKVRKLAGLEPEVFGEFGCMYDDSLGGLWIYHDESINVECAVQFAIALLNRWESHEVLTWTWANTCSKPRIGEFSGGAVIFNRYGAVWQELPDATGLPNTPQ